MQHPERMPDEDSDEVRDALTRVMFLGSATRTVPSWS